MDFKQVTDVVRVNDKECFQMTRRIAREEGMFVGGSCGAAVAGAMRWLEANDRPGLNVVILLPDSGSRYMSKIYNDAWMEENGYLEPLDRLGVVRDVLKGLGSPVPIHVANDVTISEAIGLMRLHGISQLPVLDKEEIVGVLHETRLLAEALNVGPAKSHRAGEFADNNYCVVDMNTEVTVVTNLLRKVRLALVLDEHDKLIGVLSRIDLIDHIARCTRGGN
jgi:cystathionine beta-synthase